MPPLQLAILPVTPYQQNCSILWCTATRRGAVIDPGGETARIRQAIAGDGLAVEKVLLTHGHHDHAAGAARLARELGVPVEGPHADDAFLLEALAGYRHLPGFAEAEPVTPRRWLADGDTVRVGEVEFTVRHCPGHTPGHVVFFQREARLALVGDVLFRGSIGRSDLPGGDQAALIRSITDKLWPLGDDVTFVPGHGPFSTFGEERRHNPFVADRVLSPPQD